MLTPPDDLAVDDLADALRSGWGIRPGSLAYAAVGFGSHHWTTTDRSGREWFVTADRAGSGGTEIGVLSAALTTTLRLNHLGLEFIVPPVTTRSGSVLQRVDGYAVTLYPHLDEFAGKPPDLIKLIARLHEATPAARTYAPIDDFVIPDRDAVTGSTGVAATGSADAGSSDTSPSGIGPYAARFQQLLADHRPAVTAAFDQYDSRVQNRRTDRRSWVITHGEPKQDNVMITATGPVLIDWETLRLAPPARDLWMFGGPSDIEEYTRMTGHPVVPDDLDLFALRWDLADLSSFASWFVRPHQETPELEIAWQACVDICENRLGNHLNRS